MLSCEEVRAELPCIETGEFAAGALRDHLASCEACRAEAERVRAELERMRGDLAALAPSPFLEDAVLEAARETRVESRGPRRPRIWIAASVALAAATLLVGVLLLDRNGTGSTAAGDGEFGEPDPGGHGLISMPPTAGEVDAARGETERRAGALVESAPGKRGAAASEFIHVARTDEDNQQLTYAPKILPPKDGAPHRWVFRESDVVKQDRMFTVAGVPVVGVATLGRELLTRIGNAKGEPAKDPVVAGLRRLSIDPGKSAYLDLEVADPSGRGATAKLRVLVSDMYTGSLVLEEPLGRALGLHHFEMPGRVTLAGDMSIGARRAWARIRIASIDFDETVEVQVLESGPTMQVKGDAPRAGRVAFRGERPDMAYVSNRWEMDEVRGGVRVKLTGLRTWQFDPMSQKQAALDMDGRSETSVAVAFDTGTYARCMVFLPPRDPGVLPDPHEILLERVTLPGPFPIAAQALIARVWRGRTAIPSSESVAFTTVADDGSVSFVRAAGEKGPLRMRLFTKDDSAGKNVRWYTFDPDAERIEPLLVEIEGGGQVTIGMHTIALVDKAPTGNRLAANPSALAALVRELQTASRAAGWKGGAGRPSPLAIRVVSGRNEPWAAVHATFYAAAQAGITKFQLALRDDPAAGVPFRLPVDRGIGPFQGYEELEEEEVTEESAVSPKPRRRKGEFGQEELEEEVTEEPAVRSPKPRRRRGEHASVELRIRREKGVTRFSWPYVPDKGLSLPPTGDLRVGSRDLEALQAAFGKLSKARAPKGRLQVQLNLQEADLEAISYAEMRNLIVVLRAAGVDDIHMLMPVAAGR